MLSLEGNMKLLKGGISMSATNAFLVPFSSTPEMLFPWTVPEIANFFSGFGFDVYQWLLAIVAALCLGMSKTGFTGMSMLGITLMAEVWPARESTGVILPMLIFGDFFAVGLFNKHALWSEVWRIMPPAFLGVVIGFGIFLSFCQGPYLRL
jgi:hypothetical protein